MQVIITFANVTAPSVEEARARMENEYYNKPHGWANGYARYLRPDGQMAGFRNSRSHLDDDIRWQKPDAFWKTLWLDRRDDRVAVDGHNQTDRIGAGYNAVIDDNRVVWETCHACSGNFVAIRHYGGDGKSTTLYIDSARHGIPELARPFVGRKDGDVYVYSSWRKDVPWWETGLSPYAPGSKGWETQQAIERAQRVRELAELRAQRQIEAVST